MQYGKIFCSKPGSIYVGCEISSGKICFDLPPFVKTKENLQDQIQSNEIQPRYLEPTRDNENLPNYPGHLMS